MTKFIKLKLSCKYLLQVVVMVFFACIMNGCSKNPDYQDSANKDTLMKLKSASTSKLKKTVSPLRIQMLRDTALSVGARGGLAHRANQLNKIIEKHSLLLHRVFNFHRILLDDSIIPPVLVEGRFSLNLADENTIRVADRNYKIIKQAKFVTASPTWRDYLIMHFCPPETPDKSLLPRNKGEVIVWKKYIEQGWEAGVAQAKLIYTENLAKLTRDYKGMILYSTLLAQNMVSPPYVATLDLGVTGNKSALNINDRVLRITALPGLKTDSSQWKTQVTQHD